MKMIKKGTKAAAAMVSDLTRAGFDSIYSAYCRPSYRKVAAFDEIRRRAMNTPGYNNDLHICAAGCQTFSTIYSFTDAAGRHIVKDTAYTTYETII